MALDPIKISEFDELTETPAPGDQLILNDISEVFDIDKTKHIKYENLVAMALIEEDLLTGEQASFDLTAIPAIYTHLKVVVSGRGSNASNFSGVRVTFNGDGGNNYDTQDMWGVGTTIEASESFADPYMSLGTIPAATAPANVGSGFTFEVWDYARTTFQKSVTSIVGLKSGTGANEMYIFRVTGFWRNTAAINRITMTLSAGNFIAGTIASLYGIR